MVNNQAIQEKIMDDYYNQIDTSMRINLLEEYIKQFPECPLNTLRRVISSNRYKESVDIDTFLWQYINLLYVYKNSNHKWFRKASEKELDSILEEIGINRINKMGKKEQEELYREFYNVSKRYISVSKNDKSYKSKYFGVLSMEEKAVDEKIGVDIWRLAVGLPERFNKQHEMEPLARAAYKAFFDSVNEADCIWRKVEEKERS